MARPTTILMASLIVASANSQEISLIVELSRKSNKTTPDKMIFSGVSIQFKYSQVSQYHKQASQSYPQ